MIAFPETAIAQVKRYCEGRVPEEALHRVRLEVAVSPRVITVVERRAPCRPEFEPEWLRFPIARFRYTARTKLWTLYWRDRNLRFHAYEFVPPSRSLEPLLAAVAVDPTCIFWG